MTHLPDQELHHHILFKEQLKEQFPNEDEETLTDTLEGMTDLTEILATVLRSSLDDAALADALQSRMGAMQERLSRIRARADKKRHLVLSTMEKAGLKNITEPDMTVSLRALSQPLVITDESKIPEAFWTAQAPKLNRNKLKTALHSDAEIPGAILGNGPMTITVRTK